MRITSVEITDYKRIHEVRITPSADAHLLLIGGRNGQGKSSTMDALTAAFGGAKTLAADPVRHGAEQASIVVELDQGKLRIERKVAVDGTTELEVRDEDDLPMKSPQKVLDALIGARFLDPLAFLQLQAKDQRAQLMKLIPDAKRIDELNAKRERGFTKRTQVGQLHKHAEGELARLPAAGKPGTPIDVAAIAAERRAIADEQRALDALVVAAREAERDTREAANRASAGAARAERIEQEIRRLGAELVAAKQEVGALDEQLAERKAAEDAALSKLEKARADADEQRKAGRDAAALDAQLAKADEHNRAIAQAEAAIARRKEASAAVEKLAGDYDELTKGLEAIDKRKAEILAAAKLPVEGLTVTDDGVELAGVPFAQASRAEQLRVSLALAIAASPGLDDVWVRDGAVLDEESLALVAEHAAAAGKRVWVERVGIADPGVIVIQDGRVAS